MREMKEREERGRERERRKEEERKNRERERAVVALHPSLVLGRSGASELRMHPTSALLNEHTRQAKNVKAAPAPPCGQGQSLCHAGRVQLEPKWVRMMMSMLLDRESTQLKKKASSLRMVRRGNPKKHPDPG